MSRPNLLRTLSDDSISIFLKPWNDITPYLPLSTLQTQDEHHLMSSQPHRSYIIPSLSSFHAGGSPTPIPFSYPLSTFLPPILPFRAHKPRHSLHANFHSRPDRYAKFMQIYSTRAFIWYLLSTVDCVVTPINITHLIWRSTRPTHSPMTFPCVAIPPCEQGGRGKCIDDAGHARILLSSISNYGGFKFSIDWSDHQLHSYLQQAQEGY